MEYREKVARLEEIVRLLEAGESELEDTLALFEEGRRLLTECTAELDAAEGSLAQLTTDEAEKSSDGP